MRVLGLILLVGGFLIRLLTPWPIGGWVLMALGVVVTIVSYLTKKK